MRVRVWQGNERTRSVLVSAFGQKRPFGFRAAKAQHLNSISCQTHLKQQALRHPIVQTSPVNFTSEMISTDLGEFGNSVGLQLVVAKPDTDGPYPTLVFNHGSTGTARSPVMFRRAVKFDALANYFCSRGWMTIFPQRRGRGKSDGLYDEGLKPGRIGYSCEPTRSLAGAGRALEDLAAVMAHVGSRPDVIRSQMLIGGASRGGALALAYAGKNPAAFRGVINFNGGWLGQGCTEYEHVNARLFQCAGAFPRSTLWLYGTRDNYYPIAHCRRLFDSFVGAGGRGRFESIRGGHMLVLYPKLWQDMLDRFLADT